MTIQIRGVYPLIRLTTALALMTLGCSAMWAGAIVLEPIANEFNTGRGNSSLIYGTFMIGFALGGVFMGRLADRMGIMIPALIGSLALPAGFYLAAHASSILEISLAFSLLCGFLGSSFSMAPLIADISHWFSRRRGLAVGIAFSGSYVAGAIWPPILQRMFDAQGWRESFIDLALITLIFMALLSLILYPKPTANKHLPNAGSANSNLTKSSISAGTLQGLICLAGFGCCVAMAMPQIHIVPYVMDLGHPAIRGAEMLVLVFLKEGSYLPIPSSCGVSSLLVKQVGESARPFCSLLPGWRSAVGLPACFTTSPVRTPFLFLMRLDLTY